jgi:hypothetical protein
MSFEAVLVNSDFELDVFAVTLAVITSRSDSGHGVSVLVSVTGRVTSTYSHFFKNSLKKSKLSSGNRAVIIV